MSCYGQGKNLTVASADVAVSIVAPLELLGLLRVAELPLLPSLSFFGQLLYLCMAHI